MEGGWQSSQALSRHLIVPDVRVGYVSNPHDHTGQPERTRLKKCTWGLASIKLCKDRRSRLYETAVSGVSGEVSFSLESFTYQSLQPNQEKTMTLALHAQGPGFHLQHQEQNPNNTMETLQLEV